MFSTKIVAMVALVLYCALWPGEIGAETISPGQSFHVVSGPLIIDGVVSGIRAQVSVTLHMDGVLVGESVLTPDSARYRFTVVANGDSARGEMRLRFASAPLLSSIEADLVSTARRGTSVVYRGNLAAWVSPDSLIYDEEKINLTPDLTAVTVVRGNNRTDVTVTLLAGSVIMYAVSVNQASPVAQISDSLVLGDVRVAPGARFTLTIPTAQQTGQMMMQAQFQSRNIPPTSFSAAIATWPR